MRMHQVFNFRIGKLFVKNYYYFLQNITILNSQKEKIHRTFVAIFFKLFIFKLENVDVIKLIFPVPFTQCF